MTVAEAIRTMRAVRQFTEEPLSEEDTTAVLNAGRRAQSSKNTQPWQFVAVRERATLQQLATTGTFAGHMAGAALGVVLVGATPADFDLGQATALMMLTAWERGLGACIATIYEPDQARAILGIPADQYVHWAISFGHPAQDRDAAPLRKGGRHPLDEVVRWEHW